MKHFRTVTEATANFLERMWPYFLIGALLVAIGCTAAQRTDAGKAITDEAIEHGPVIMEKAAEGDWLGAGIAFATAIVGAVGGYFVYQRKRKQNASN